MPVKQRKMGKLKIYIKVENCEAQFSLYNNHKSVHKIEGEDEGN